MNPSKNGFQKASEIIQKSASGAICLAENPTVDAIAAATALYLGLSKIGKSVSLACSGSIKSELVAADKIQPSPATSGDNLVVSFPYADGSVDKVDYYIQGNNFNIVVVPAAEQTKLDPKQVKFSYTGGTVDFIVTIDVDSLRKLGALYSDNQDLFKGKSLINIDRHLTNGFFGSANLVNKAASSVSEMVLSLLEAMKWPIDKDIATNLYAGLVAATNNFSSYSVNAQTFEMAAYLLKRGAVKRPAVSRMTGNSFFPATARSGGFEKDATVKPIESVEPEAKEDQGTNGKPAEENWLKPKIFRPSGDLS